MTNRSTQLIACRLLATYAYAVDNGDPEILRRLFDTESEFAAVLKSGEHLVPPIVGRNGIIAHFVAQRASRSFVRRHFVSNVKVRESTFRMIRAVAYVLVVDESTHGPMNRGMGLYDARLHRTVSGWRISDLVVRLDQDTYQQPIRDA